MVDRPAGSAPTVPDERQEPGEPVRRIPTDDVDEALAGTGLCLSGGGYRAMLFHLGALWRLNEARLLARLDRISSVSGGSITAATLGLRWDRLDFVDGVAQAFEREVADPIRAMASQGIDVGSVLAGLVGPGTIADKVAAAYRRHLFGDATLQDLPEAPRFVINATNMGSGALVRFEREQLADWRVGRIERPTIDLAVAVACSSAFPPVLSPYRLQLRDAPWQTEEGNDLAQPQHRDQLVLSDGGVYDNLGLETVWKRCKRVLVSDAGGQMAADPDPDVDWPRHMLRVLKVIDNQVRSLRKQQVIDGFERSDRGGVYLGIRSHVADYGLADPLDAPPERTLELAEIATRLDALDQRLQERLVNWGYVICDTGLRRHVDPTLTRPAALPYLAAAI